jgi:hypothetical protein
MHDEISPGRPGKSGLRRRIAVALALGAIVCLALWWLALSLLSAVVIGAGTAFLVVGGASLSDVIEATVDWIASILGWILAGILAVLAAIMSLFDF